MGFWMKWLVESALVIATAPVTLPVALVTAAVVGLAMGRPVLFVAERAGRGGRPFRMLKFRTMRPGPGTDGERLTRVGRILRATSLDELPQLLHVLTGTMSLVGPRPLPTAYVSRYTPEQARRLEVRPGITGWAQVNGRNALSWEEKFALDVWYVDHRSLLLDAKILLLTVFKLVRPANVNHAGCDTMSEFTGTAAKTPGS